MELSFFCLLFMAFIGGCGAYDYCTWYLQCNDGYYCCDYNTRCCSNVVLSIGAIIGIVIGCIVVISIVVAVVCCCMKTKGRSGQVITPYPSTGAHVTIVSTGQYSHQPYGQSYGHTIHAQPAFGQLPQYGAPNYGFQQSNTVTSDPVYPPASATY